MPQFKYVGVVVNGDDIRLTITDQNGVQRLSLTAGAANSVFINAAVPTGLPEVDEPGLPGMNHQIDIYLPIITQQ